MSVADAFQDEPFEPEVLERVTAYRGRVWDVVDERFRYGGGELRRHYVDHPGAVAVLALDTDDRVCLIQQYRHPIRSRDWELPAGLLDVAGEAPLAAARRELAEEVDLVADEWALLADMAVTPGGSDEYVRILLARALTTAPSAFEREAEEADLVVHWTPLTDAVAAVREGRIRNGIACYGILTAWFERERGWSGLRDPGEPWPGRRSPAS